MEDDKNKVDNISPLNGSTPSEEFPQEADNQFNRDYSYQVHPSASPAPPYLESRTGIRKAKNKSKFIGPISLTAAIIILAVLVVILGGVLFAVNYKIDFTGSGGSFNMRLTRRGSSDGGNSSNPNENSSGSQQTDPNSQNPDNTGNSDTLPEHTWNGSTLDLKHPDDGRVRMNYRQIYQKCSASVVGITSVSSAYGSGTDNAINPGSGTHHATGIIMTDDGYIITVCSAVMAADSIKIAAGGKDYPAVIVGLDYATDLAVLKINTEGLKLTPAEFGSSEGTTAGDIAAVVGNPVGGVMNLFNGIVSAVNDEFSYRGYGISVIQIYMNLGSGAAGSPLINELGQVIGIVDMAIAADYPEADSINFALSISEAKPIIDELLEYGYIAGRPASGITVTNISPAVAAFYRLPEGVAVTAVEADGTAAKAGIQKGDVIYEANGAPISSSNDLYAVINGMSAGDKLTLGVYRDGETGFIAFDLMEAFAPKDTKLD